MPVAAVLFFAACTSRERPTELRVGATTTIEDSGLLQVIDSAFQTTHPQYRLRFITGGTGEVLEIARRGDLDVTWTHDPDAEAAYIAAGNGVDRNEIMYNDFVIAGTPEDPAGVAAQPEAAAALMKIAGARARFVSRGDESGTHRREQQLWRSVKVNPDTLAKQDFYVVAGVGMGDALRIANDRAAYLLTDRATFTKLSPTLRLVIHVQGDPRLINRYAAIVQKNTPRREAADAFVRYLTGDGAAVIARFGLSETGRPLFHPGAAPIQ